MKVFEQTSFEIVAKDYDTAIIPVGSFEQHGAHLPVTTDVVEAEELGNAIAEKMGWYCLPALPISTCREHMGRKGSVWMAPDVFYSMLQSILDCLKEQGFRRVVVLPSHGAIFPIIPLVRHLNATNDRNFLVCHCNPFLADLSGVQEFPGDVHAGEVETSLMLYLRPDLVHMDRAVDSVPACTRDRLNYDSILRLSPAGIWGKPTLATAEKGKEMFDRMVDYSISYIEEIFEYLSTKEYFGYPDHKAELI